MTRVIALALVASSLVGCANLTSINRDSGLASSRGYSHRGKAIHLDIKQRVVLSRPGFASTDPDVVCAEPSPDALSAFAAAAGAGVSASGYGSGSAAGAFSEGAAMVGLRTQSITLMRDHMYRICEAYYNGKLSKAQIMTLLTRGQDLTAAMVAIEQLTGVAMAQQAAIGTNSNASASATMVANTAALTQMRELKKRADETLAADEKAVESAKADKDTAEGNCRTATNAEPSDPAATKIACDEYQKRVAIFDQKVTVRDSDKKTCDDIEKTIASLEKLQDSTATMAVAGAGSTSTLSGGSAITRFADGESTKAIATAVQAIATLAISKNYLEDQCIAYLTADTTTSNPATVAICKEVLSFKFATDEEAARKTQLGVAETARQLNKSLQALRY